MNKYAFFQLIAAVAATELGKPLSFGAAPTGNPIEDAQRRLWAFNQRQALGAVPAPKLPNQRQRRKATRQAYANGHRKAFA
jgi:hypothetical protein